MHLSIKFRVESPAESLVRAFGALDIRNGNDRDLELHIDAARFRGLRVQSRNVPTTQRHPARMFLDRRGLSAPCGWPP